MDGESLLGPLPPSWEIHSVHNPGGQSEPRYWNVEKKTESRLDPRLGPLPDNWESIDQAKTVDDPLHFAPHRNRVTGEVINSDPRLLPEALIARGVKLQNFILV